VCTLWHTLGWPEFPEAACYVLRNLKFALRSALSLPAEPEALGAASSGGRTSGGRSAGAAVATSKMVEEQTPGR
jgi:hypothetical protein